MSNSRIVSLAIAICALSFSVRAHAQIVGPPVPNVFGDMENRLREQKSWSPGSGMNTMRGYEATLDRSLEGDEPLSCEEGGSGPSCEGGAGIPLPPMVPGKKQQAVSPLAPMRSHSSTMFADSYVEQQFSFLASTWTIADITMNYLDAGVAGGINSSHMKGSLALANRYAAEGAFLKQLDFVPEVRELVGSSYVSCLADKGGGVVASNACLEDSMQTAEQFPAAPAPTEAKWFTFNKDHQGNQPDKILLTDMLIRPSVAAGLEEGDASLYRHSFQDLFGDKEFELVSRGAGLGKNLLVKNIPPTRRPAVLDREIHESTWYLLHELMRGYCVYWMSEENDMSASNFDLRVERKGFWKDLGKTYSATGVDSASGPTAWTYISLTTSTFEFTPLIGDNLFALFLKTQALSQGSHGELGLDCDILKSAGPNDLSNFDEVSKKPEENALEWRRMFSRVVNIITIGKRYGMYLQARRWVNQQTAASADGQMLRAHVDSLLRAASIREPGEVENTISEVTRNFVVELNKMAQSRTGKQGQQLQQTYETGNSTQLTSGVGKGS